MRLVFRALVTFALFVPALPAIAQPVLTVNASEVPSGGNVTVTITGTPGLYWALAGSSRDNGFVYGGVALAVGSDVQVLASGFFNPSGTVSLPFTPPLGNGIDTYFLQAVTASNPSYVPPSPSNPIALRPRGLYANSPTFAAGLSAGGARVTGVAAPSAGSDAATKTYVDSAVVGGFGTSPVFASGLSANGARITSVGTPVAGTDAVTKNYVDTSAVLLGPALKQPKNTSGALINLEQTGSGDLLSLRIDSTTVPGYPSPLTKQVARLQPDSGLVLSGTLGIGIIPTTGAGERMMWHPYKAAFRAGSIGYLGTEWDDPNVGFYTWAGGYNTIALGLSSFAMGYQAQALGSYSNALGYSTLADGTGAIAIGYRSAVCSDYGVAIGQRASTSSAPTSGTPCGGTPHAGAIVLADGSTTAHVGANANNQFVVRAAGGYSLYTNATLTTGVSLAAGGASWSVISDRNAKFGFEPVDEQDILRRLMTLPLSSFLYKDGDGRRYLGPMAQDFHAAFGLGTDDTRIAMNDIDGVSLASLKALGVQVQALRDANRRLADDYARATADAAALRATLDEVLRRLSAIETPRQ